MKHKFKMTIIGGLIFSYLFYQQNFGLNAIVFSIVLLIFMIIQYPKFINNKYSIICGIGSLFTAFFIYWNNSTISIIAYFISIFGIMAFKNEGLFTILNYVISYIINLLSSPFLIFINYTKSLTENKDKHKENEHSNYDKIKSISSILAAILIIIIFFFVYQNANPLFYQFTKDISLCNVDFGFIFFALLGCLIMFVFIYNTYISVFFEIEKKQNNCINTNNYIQSFIEKYRLQTILFLFVVLNLMLVFINVLDVNYLYLSNKLPNGITHSQFVHNGVGTLIFSIVLGTSIICYLFKGELNFDEDNKTIKLLVYFWIVQNIFMVISTVLRNNFYVFDFGLTGKRIGVYYYLFFTIIGLLFTAYKIYKQKTVYFLYSTNTWIWYIIFVFSCSINWENIIFKNQINRFTNTRVLDFDYATRFTETNLPELISLFNVGKTDSIDFNISKNTHPISNKFSSLKSNVENKLVNFLIKYNKTKWQSTNKNDNVIYNEIIHLNKEQQFKSIKIYAYRDYYESSKNPIESIACLTNLKSLTIIGNCIDYKNLSLLKNIEKVKWQNVNFQLLKYFKKMPNLKELELCNVAEPSENYFESILPNVSVTIISESTREN